MRQVFVSESLNTRFDGSVIESNKRWIKIGGREQY